MKRFEQSVRRYLERTVPRLMLVLDPVPVVIEDAEDQASGAVKEIKAIFDKDAKKPKTYIQWVPEGSLAAEVRIHKNLFKSEQPSSAPGGFMDDIVPDSETIWPNAMIEAGFHEVRRRVPWPEAEGEKTGDSGPESVRFQAMRVAYVALDSDSTDGTIVLNRIVTLKEDAGKSI
ncbi:Glutamine-tRNA ligase [Daldinia childiae]|uniref:Glutamine-tRNA ligase n=1 Tax=Daldinia childiae TaxID=326645 RepID=UPI0014471CB4|nr:Glutamine-tRNA ligase [Daldinia childiae]KAF3066491.1 Glutamine-tRNA ligase [Daldinia childiae]